MIERTEFLKRIEEDLKILDGEYEDFFKEKKLSYCIIRADPATLKVEIPLEFLEDLLSYIKIIKS